MKTALLFILLLGSHFVFGQEGNLNASQKRKDSVNTYWNFHRARWGFLNIEEQFLAEQTEITIGEWLNYIYYSDLKSPITTTGGNISEQVENQLINTKLDTTLLPIYEFLASPENQFFFTKCTTCGLLRIRSLDGFAFLPFESNLIKDKKSRKRIINKLRNPIAGITYEQAVNFCKWRTALDSLRRLPKVDANTSVWNAFDNAAIYRLPTEEEFSKMNPQFDSITDSNLSHFNYKESICPDKKAEPEEKTNYGKYSIDSYSHHLSKSERHLRLKDVFNVQGNVAEMTSQKGIAKGGSYFHYAKDSYNDKVIRYVKPELWLGFRCIAEQRKK